MRHPDVLARVVRTIDPVADIGRGGERLKTVQESRGNVEMSKVVVVEQKRLMLTESWGFPANIDEHIVNRTVGATHQLCLAATGAPVHAANATLRRTRLRVLDERRGCAGHADVVVEDLSIERSGEQPTIVTERLRHKNNDTFEPGLFDSHGAMLP